MLLKRLEFGLSRLSKVSVNPNNQGSTTVNTLNTKNSLCTLLKINTNQDFFKVGK